MNDMRKCLVTVDSKKPPYEAMFHRWADEAFVIEPSPMIGGTPGGQVKYTRAIVEDAVGQVHMVHPACIKFI